MAVTIGESREALDARIKKYRDTLVTLMDTYDCHYKAITSAMLVTGSMVYDAKEQYRLLKRMYSEAMGKRDAMALDSGELRVENSR